ncbi:hypothetical protein [Alteromonas sp. BMJM2]|uniref:hypothetical protein n=1 Tax=Alteromonas sp. BMJM2 TaxID=2954241 RepID=UPI0022B349B2|nr:hypothetical protein [Alteromonas sp. BMJM2]
MLTHVRKLSSMLAALTATTLIGCSISPEHHVRTGADPRYQDKNVAFQTTYYFRVFDYCAQNKVNNNAGKYPSSGGLYRFKMTGKASTWANKIKFESGIVKSWEIDPLGANVIFDENIGRHRFVSENETQDEAAKEQAWVDYTKLKTEFLTLAGENKGAIDTKNALSSKLHSTILSEGSVAENDALLLKIDNEFETHKKSIGGINDEVKTKFKTSVNIALESLQKENKEKLNHAFYSAGLDWLLGVTKAKLAEKIEQELVPNIPDNLFSDKDNSVANWNSLIGQLKGPHIDFSNNSIRSQYIKALATVYSQTANASNIASATIVLSGTPVKVTNKLSELFIEKVEDFEVRDISDGARNIFSEFKTKTKVIADSQQPDQVSYKMLDANLKMEIQERLTKYVNDLFTTQPQFLAFTKELPEPSTVDFESGDSSLSGMLAIANETAIRTALAEVTKTAINNAVTDAYYQPNSQLYGILSTLKSAMAKKLALASGSPVLSDGKSDMQLTKLLSSNRAISCDINERRGFQILGPEGWRTFNQDERLIMAMSADNKPITQTLKALSQQVLNAQTSNESEGNLLPIVQAELRLNKAMNTINVNKVKLFSSSEQEKGKTLCELSKSVVAQLSSSAIGDTVTPIECEEGQQ